MEYDWMEETARLLAVAPRYRGLWRLVGAFRQFVHALAHTGTTVPAHCMVTLYLRDGSLVYGCSGCAWPLPPEPEP